MKKHLFFASALAALALIWSVRQAVAAASASIKSQNPDAELIFGNKRTTNNISL